VSSQAAKSVELHRMTSANGMMKMREVKAIELPAGKRVNLREGGYHLMLTGLKTPLKEGATLPLTLNIKVDHKHLVKIKIEAKVKSLHATSDAEKDDEHLRDAK
jgi:copper(I)-binding protein